MTVDNDWAAVISNMRKVRKRWFSNDMDPWAGGGERTGLSPILQGRGPSCPTIQV